MAPLKTWCLLFIKSLSQSSLPSGRILPSRSSNKGFFTQFLPSPFVVSVSELASTWLCCAFYNASDASGRNGVSSEPLSTFILLSTIALGISHPLFLMGTQRQGNMASLSLQTQVNQPCLQNGMSVFVGGLDGWMMGMW